MEISYQEAARSVRLAYLLWAGDVGPKMGIVSGAMTVAHLERMSSVIKRGRTSGMFKGVDNTLMLSQRRFMSRCVEIAGVVLRVTAEIRKGRPEDWKNFLVLVEGKTVNSLMRLRKKENRALVILGLEAITSELVGRVGKEEMETLLTLRG